MKKVLFFRKQLLPFSETFIAQQGLSLNDYQILFAGIEKTLSGFPLLKNSKSILLDDYTKFLKLEKLLMKLAKYNNQKWINAIKTEKVNLIHAHFGPDAVTALPLSEQLSIPLLSTFHGSDITVNSPRKSYISQRQELFKKADQIIAVSDFVKRKLIQKGCPEKKVVHLPIGVNLNLFVGDNTKTEYPSIIFVGRFTENKGLKYLIEAVKILKRSIPNLQVKIVGEGKDRKHYENICIENNLPIKFLGKLTPEEVKTKVGQSWVLCVPSVRVDSGSEEGLGMVFLEAQALKVPVVSFATGGITEAVIHEKTGLLAEQRNVNELSEYLKLLLCDDELRKCLGESGRVHVEQNYNLFKQSKKLESLYDQII